jgi:hypothetical protein
MLHLMSLLMEGRPLEPRDPCSWDFHFDGEALLTYSTIWAKMISHSRVVRCSRERRVKSASKGTTVIGGSTTPAPGTSTWTVMQGEGPLVYDTTTRPKQRGQVTKKNEVQQASA